LVEGDDDAVRADDSAFGVVVNPQVQLVFSLGVRHIGGVRKVLAADWIEANLRVRQGAIIHRDPARDRGELVTLAATEREYKEQENGTKSQVTAHRTILQL
jgi:hypothetical protein